MRQRNWLALVLLALALGYTAGYWQASERAATDSETHAQADSAAHPALSGQALIDPNHASREELMLLPGIGPVMAERIIGERANGPYARPEDLLRVKGIGRKTLYKLEGQLRFDPRKD